MTTPTPSQTMDHAPTSLRPPHHVISTSSDDLHQNDSSTDSANEWTVPTRHRRLKKKRNLDSADVIPPTPPLPTVPTTTSNPFTHLPVDVPPTASTKEPSTLTPPPIFIRTITDYILLTTDLNRLIGQENYSTKSTMSGLTLKTNTPTAYRTAVTYLRDKCADFHTYQSPTDRPYRVAIRHLHPATPTTDIIAALEGKGHRVRNVHNVIHPRLKVPLALFFVDLEPAENNKKIFEIPYLLNSAIQVEEPYKRVEIPGVPSHEDLLQSSCTVCQVRRWA